MSPRENQKLAKIRRIAVELYANDDIEFDEPLKPEDIQKARPGPGYMPGSGYQPKS